MKIRVLASLLISVVFIYFAFKDVNFQEALDAVKHANYGWLIPAILAMLLSHWLRAIRWQYLMAPIKKIRLHPLFSALMIGYAANNVFPLRVGEFLRAFAIGKTQNVSKTSAFATVIFDRLLDLMSLLLVLAVTLYWFPFPENIKKGAYVISVGTIGLVILIILLMQKTEATLAFMEKLLPDKIFEIVQKLLRSFLQGFLVLKKSEHFPTITLLSISVWLLYAFVVYISFFIFDMDTNYEIGFIESLVVLVIISIGLMIPSSPGFVGTYHWFCIMSLSLFSVPRSEAASFAIISHLMNTIPITIVGMLYFWKENLHFSDAISEKEAVEHANQENPLPGAVHD